MVMPVKCGRTRDDGLLGVIMDLSGTSDQEPSSQLGAIT